MLKGFIMQMLMRGAMAPMNKGSGMRMFLHFAAGVLICVAAGFLIVATHLWFKSQYSLEVANLISAGAVMGLAIICLIAAWMISLRQKSYLRQAQKDMQENLKGVFELLDDSVGQNVRDHPAMSLLIAGVAGYALTDLAS